MNECLSGHKWCGDGLRIERILFVRSEYPLTDCSLGRVRSDHPRLRITVFNRRYIFKWLVFHCHISFLGCNFEGQLLFFEPGILHCKCYLHDLMVLKRFCVRSSNQHANGMIGIILMT